MPHLTNSQLVITIAHALIGWSLCGATMGIGMATTTFKRALIIHAVAAPVIFGVISYVYFTHFGYATPFMAALIFIGTVVSLDFFIVAFLMQRNLSMFRSIVGTWLPFILIFNATCSVGYIVGNHSP